MNPRYCCTTKNSKKRSERSKWLIFWDNLEVTDRETFWKWIKDVGRSEQHGHSFAFIVVATLDAEVETAFQALDAIDRYSQLVIDFQIDAFNMHLS